MLPLEQILSFKIRSLLEAVRRKGYQTGFQKLSYLVKRGEKCGDVKMGEKCGDVKMGEKYGDVSLKASFLKGLLKLFSSQAPK